MELVKKGRKQGGWAKKFKCTGEGNEDGGCGAVLLVSQIDLYQTSRDSHDETEFFLTFCCSECGVETDIDGVSVEPLGKRPSEKKRKAIARKGKPVVTMKGMQGEKIRIVLGSTNAYKLEAVRKACERFGMNASVSGVKTSSGQNEQPVGFEETFNGALTRARLARVQDIDAVSIGIESGIFRFRFNGGMFISIDVAVIVLITPNNRQIVTTSAGIVFPEDCVEIAESRGFKLTSVGSVIVEKFRGDPADPHSTLTNGRLSRETILTDALVTAFGQI